jgi:hypothetical protein
MVVHGCQEGLQLGKPLGIFILKQISTNTNEEENFTFTERPPDVV